MKMGIYLREVASSIRAAWILPNKKVLDVGGQHHIDFVLKSPSKFGLTTDDIKDCIRYGEDTENGLTGITTYLDGVAGGLKIIPKVVETGFIRLRKVRTNKYSFSWFIDVDKFNHRTKKILSDFAYSIITDKTRDTKVMISTLHGSEAPKNLTIRGLANLVESHELLLLTTLDEMENLI